MALSGQTYDRDLRASIIFTSTLRRALTEADGGAALFAPGNAQQRHTSLLGAYRKGYLFSQIPMAVNPSSIRWEQGKRITKVDVKEGSKFFHFLNSEGRNNNYLKLTFQGSTGNIDPRSSNTGYFAGLSGPEWFMGGKESLYEGTGAHLKWLTWHNLYQLSREEILLPNNMANVFTIYYASRLFPTNANATAPILQLDGFFADVLQFVETAEKPHSRDYTFSFIVTRTYPDLADYLNTAAPDWATPFFAYDARNDVTQSVNEFVGTSVF